jgi:hypothetical protein
MFENGVSHRGLDLEDGCKHGVEEAGAAMVPSVHIPGGPGTFWQRAARASGAQAFIVTTFAFPLSDEKAVSAAVVWLTDASGLVRDADLWRGGESLGDPTAVGRDLCRKVLAHH